MAGLVGGKLRTRPQEAASNLLSRLMVLLIYIPSGCLQKFGFILKNSLSFFQHIREMAAVSFGADMMSQMAERRTLANAMIQRFATLWSCSAHGLWR